MVIAFNNIPTTLRTPGAFVEIDSSRALKGLVQNPHTVLILGQKETDGTAAVDVLEAISRDSLADGFFGPGSILARMCNTFKQNNPNTELFAMALSENAAGAAGSGNIDITGSASGDGTAFLLIGGVKVNTPITSGWSGADVASAMASDINANSSLSLRASLPASVDNLLLIARGSALMTNQFDFRFNYFEGESNPIGVTFSTTGMAGGAGNPDIGDAWAVIENKQFQHIIQPYRDATNLTSLEGELSDRFGPLVDLAGHGYTAERATQASATTLGNTRNSPHNTIVAANDSPTNPEEWAAAWGAIASFNLNVDPARPLHTLKLAGILPPPIENRFTRTERDILLFDGIATFTVDNSGGVLIERSITTFQTNALGLPDVSFLDIQTLFTLIEIRFQYKVRMVNRFIIPRFKLADDTFPVPPFSKIATPSIVKQETIALFTLLRDTGLIENLEEFTENLVVERNVSDVNRIDVLLPPDLINQFRVLAAQIQFVL